MNTNHGRTLRIISLIVALGGFLIYGFLIYGWTIEWSQNPSIHESLFTQAFFVVDTVIFLSGLPPIILVTYFLVLGKTRRDWSMGLLFIFLSIPVHYYVAGVTAHTTPQVYVPIHLAELGLVVGLIALWHRKFRKHH